MRKLLLPVLLVLSGIASAETRYDFSYTGLYDPWHSGGIFFPDYKYRGFFTVEDTNGDGRYQRNEVLEFFIGWRSEPLYDVLGPWEYSGWGNLEFFNYTPGGQLTFMGGHQYLSDSILFSNWEYRNTYFANSYETGPETIISVVQVVPEPSTLMMFGGGISAALLAARRRRLQINT